VTALLLTSPAWLAFAAFAGCLLAETLGSPRAGVVVAWMGLSAAAIAGFLGATLPAIPIAGLALAGGGTSWIAGVMLACAGAAVFTASESFGDSAAGARTSALMAAGAGAAAVALAARDLLVLVVALETLALAGYALVAAAGTPRAAIASTTYFIQGAVAAGFLLFGTGAAIVLGGTTRLAPLVASGGPSGPLFVTSILVAAALLFKAGAFPLHSWVPDAYQNADPGPAAFLASVPKTAALVVAATVMPLLFAVGVGSALPSIAALVAAASVVFGTVAGLRQRDYRRMLGYSAIAQAGFAIMALTEPGGARGAVALMALVYAVATVGAFAAAEALRLAEPGWDGSISGMAGLSRRFPALSTGLAVALFSLTGIPPLAGFWGKLGVLTVAVSTGRVWLAVVGGLASVVSFGYYGRVLRVVWLEEPSPRSGDAPLMTRAGRPATLVVLLVAAILVVTGLLPLVAGIGTFAFLGL
jgi:NADH-quinone oxidoreductase subunit N